MNLSFRLVALFSMIGCGPLFGQAISTLHPEKVIGAERCEKCHTQELQAWHLSKHSRSDSVHRDPKTAGKAKEIAMKMGLRSVNDIATSALCTECHFTRQQTGNVLKVISGVSCESCHGGAKDWVDVHGDKEKIASHDERIQKAIAGGMLNPRNIYQVAENCFSCHVARDEKLINVGGHPARSEGFELASWSQGEVRHHFYTNSTRHEKDNKMVPQPLKRMMYVTGLLLDLEHSLRGLAAGVQKGNQFPFRQTMGRRAFAILNTELPALIAKLGGDGAPEELRQILAIGKATSLGAEAAVLIKSADDIKAQIEAFGQKNDGSSLGGVDALIPAAVRGTPFQPK